MRRMHKDDAARLLTEAVELHGADRTSNPHCGFAYFVYEPEGFVSDKPVSLVGAVAILWGDQGLVYFLKDKNVWTLWHLSRHGEIHDFVTPSALGLLIQAQSYESQGWTWGEAVQATLQDQG